MPVFVLTHHARRPLEMQGGTTFHLVTEGIHTALEKARKAAGGKDILLGGGVSAGMARFDTRGTPDLGERVAAIVATVLLFPLVNGLGDALPQRFRGGGFPWEHSVFVANSLLLATVLTSGVVWVRRRLQAQARP